MLSEGVRVDIDRDVGVVTDGIVQKCRLRTTDEDRGAVVRPAAETVVRALAAGAWVVLLDHTVGNAGIGLVEFDDVEAFESTLDLAVVAATKGDVGMVHVQLAEMPNEQSRPIPARRIHGTGINARMPIVIGVEGSAGTVSVIQFGCEDDFLAVESLGNQLGTEGHLDACPLELDHRTRVDLQTGIRTCTDDACQPRIQLVRYQAGCCQIESVRQHTSVVVVRRRRGGVVDDSNQGIRTSPAYRTTIDQTAGRCAGRRGQVRQAN